MVRLVRIAAERIEHDSVSAEPMQLCQVVEDLVDRSLTGEASGAGDRRFGQPQGDARHQAGDRSSLGVRELRQPVHRLSQPGHGEPERMPCVAQPHRTAQAGLAVPADPYRYPPTAVVLVVLPGRADGPQVVVGQLAPLPERDAERIELLRRPADAYPRTRRPPLSSLRLAAIRATSSGCRYGTIRTVVPSMILPVRPASQASVVKGS